MARLLRAGRIGSPHGLDGSFHVVDAVPSLLGLGEQVMVGETWRVITRRAGHERRVILRMEGCEDRNAAQALRGSVLQVGRDGAPPLDPEEWWADDLEGCSVRDGEVLVGTVRRLVGMPSCEILEVERPAGGDLLVPLIADAVRSVDIDARSIDIDLVFLGVEGA